MELLRLDPDNIEIGLGWREPDLDKFAALALNGLRHRSYQSTPALHPRANNE